MLEPEDILSELPSEDSKREWYYDHDPGYRSRWGATPLTLSEQEVLDRQARRFISHWLEVDNHDFPIPGNAWGADLLWALRRTMSATNTFRKITVTPDTTAWTDGFERVNYPWLEFYTEDSGWAEALPPRFEKTLAEDGFDQAFIVTVSIVTSRVVISDDNAQRWRRAEPELAAEEIANGFERFPGFVYATDEELDALLQKRLSEWS